MEVGNVGNVMKRFYPDLPNLFLSVTILINLHILHEPQYKAGEQEAALVEGGP